MATEEEYELIEVPVKRKIEVRLTLEDLLKAVADQANSIATQTQQTPSNALDRLRQLGQLAQEVRNEVRDLPRGGSA
jgi:hypothetical protein